MDRCKFVHVTESQSSETSKDEGLLDLWAITVGCHEGFKFLNGKVFLLAILGLNALLGIQFLHWIVSDDTLTDGIVESSREHAEVTACRGLADRSWINVLEV